MTVRRYRLQPSTPAATFRIDYAGQLNEEQLAVVEAPSGPLLVIAGAGSGKTRTLIFRLARMLESGIPPEQLLLLTFTNRAAREMIRRAEELVSILPGIDVRRITGGTFHHVGFGILREHARLVGYEEGFGILDREDQADLFSSCIGELGAGRLERRFPTPKLVAQLYSNAINTQRSLTEVIANRAPRFEELEGEILQVITRYVERKVELNVMDFDDLLLQWKRLLVQHPNVRSHLQERFRCVLVDEYQDTNRLQGEIVDLLAAGHKNLTVVGDDAQSIYSFRGADFSNILEFPARYRECQVHKLTVNYRSSPEILHLANASIAQNVRQYPKELRPARESSGVLPALVPTRDAVQQASFVAQRILELRDEGIPLEEMAVLYRAHSHSLELQIELARRGIPFVTRSGNRFFEQAHIKDVLAHLRIAANPRDELAFKRVVRLYPGIGQGLAVRLWDEFRSAWEARSSGSPDEPSGEGELAPLSIAPERLAGVARKAQGSWERCSLLLERLRQPILLAAPDEALLTVLESGYQERLESESTNAQARVDDIRQLADYARQYPDVRAFLADVSLLSELSGEDVDAGSEPDEYLTLSTVHQAKGLEWRAVFVIWLADGRFPSVQSLRDQPAEEEERRCFYVSVTRAKDELYLSYPLLEAPRDSRRVILSASRFVDELALEEGTPPFEKWAIDEEPLPAAPDQAALPGSQARLGAGEPPDDDG